MRNAVVIKLDANGNAIRQNQNNPEYGYIILSQKRVTIDTNGWVNKKTFTALIKGEISDLKDSGIGDMKQLPGNIIVKESTDPFQSYNPDKDLKIAGDTGIILCTQDGEPIYRQTIYDGSGLMTDILIPHANGSTVKEVINVMNVSEKPKRKRRTKAEMEAAKVLEMSNENTITEKDFDDIIEDNVNEIEIEIEDNTIFDM